MMDFMPSIKESILIVDDEYSVRQAIKLIFEEEYNVQEAKDGEEALKLVKESKIDLVLLDIKMPGISGMKVLEEIDKIDKDIEIIMVTATKDADVAVQSLKMGAENYITKPFEMDDLITMVRRLLAQKKAKQKRQELSVLVETEEKLGEIIGNSDIINGLRKGILHASKLDKTVLIYGEKGTEKERVAYQIHSLSSRSQNLFSKINCNKAPHQFIEDLLGTAYAYEQERKVGEIEKAKGGTIYLEEINAASPLIQEKILKMLQNKVYEPVGSKAKLPLDSRVIVSVSLDLEKLVKTGIFSEELFHYLAVIEINIPSLSERIEDLPLFVDHFIDKYNKQYGKSLEAFSEECLTIMANYVWPGNVDQLESLICYLIQICNKKIIDIVDLPIDFYSLKQEGSKFKLTLEDLKNKFKKAYQLKSTGQN